MVWCGCHETKLALCALLPRVRVYRARMNEKQTQSDDTSQCVAGMSWLPPSLPPSISLSLNSHPGFVFFKPNKC